MEKLGFILEDKILSGVELILLVGILEIVEDNSFVVFIISKVVVNNDV